MLRCLLVLLQLAAAVFGGFYVREDDQTAHTASATALLLKKGGSTLKSTHKCDRDKTCDAVRICLDDRTEDVGECEVFKKFQLGIYLSYLFRTQFNLSSIILTLLHRI